VNQVLPLWSIATALALLAILMVHLWWRHRLASLEQEWRTDLDRLKKREQRQLLQLRSQQETLLNSMVEALLVLDERGRIELANRAVAALLDVNGDIRGKTILEALRLHELADLVPRLALEGQPLQRELRLPGTTDRWLQVNAAPITGPDGRPTGTLIVLHDSSKATPRRCWTVPKTIRKF